MTGASPVLRWRNAGRRIMRVGKYAAGHSAWSLPILFRLTPEGTDRQITDDTAMVVEGFPRSGNTYTTFALKLLAGRSIHIASHAHHPGQVKLGLAKGLPTLVVVRPPVDTLASYLIAGPHGTPGMVLREYRYYHRAISRLGDDLMLATFDQVTGDTGGLARRLNERHSLGLDERTPDETDEAAIVVSIDRHFERVHTPADIGMLARPDNSRDDLNRHWREQLTRSKHAGVLADCNALYDNLARHATDT